MKIYCNNCNSELTYSRKPKIPPKTCRRCRNTNKDGFTLEEINNIKLYYPSGGSNLCKNYINRTRASIRVKASLLGIHRTKNIAPTGFKKCGRCHVDKEIIGFGVDNKRKDKHNPICKMCLEINRDSEDFKFTRRIREQKYKQLPRTPRQKINSSVRRRLKHALHWKKNVNKAKTVELIGCSVNELRCHLESKFQTGMSWENYGFGDDKWHIDHIIPCKNFNLFEISEQKKCFHYSNLQPLWQKDNLSKGCKL